MIDVRLYASLVRASGAGSAEFRVEARPGLSVGDLLAKAGVRPEDVNIIMVNGRRAEVTSLLSDGDRVGLFPAVSGG